MTVREDVRRILRYHLKTESPTPALVNDLVSIVEDAASQAANDATKRTKPHSRDFGSF